MAQCDVAIHFLSREDTLKMMGTDRKSLDPASIQGRTRTFECMHAHTHLHTGTGTQLLMTYSTGAVYLLL